MDTAAYASTERGQTTIYVEPFPATGAKHQFAGRGADTPKHPRWSPDGRELFLNISATSFASVSVTTQPAFASRQSGSAAEDAPGRSSRHANTIRCDARRSVRGPGHGRQSQFGRGSENQIQVVLNWTEELSSRVVAR